jgi:hypothetical protein
MRKKIETLLAEKPSLKTYLYAIPAFLLFVVLFHFFPPAGIDWRFGFYEVAQNPLNPYEATNLFINPPWIAVLLLPFGVFTEITSLAINTSLNLVLIGLLVVSRKGTKLALILTLTSFPILSMISNGNIEWIPALGFLLQNKWSVPLLFLKPQVGILAILSWDSFQNNKRAFLIPSLFIILFSFTIWGNWIAGMHTNIQSMQNAQRSIDAWNISFFPWSIPVGLLLIYIILKHRPADSEILSVVATLCLVPYFAIYSTGILFALISASHKRLALVLWALLWLYPFLAPG